MPTTLPYVASEVRLGGDLPSIAFRARCVMAEEVDRFWKCGETLVTLFDYCLDAVIKCVGRSRIYRDMCTVVVHG